MLQTNSSKLANGSSVSEMKLPVAKVCLNSRGGIQLPNSFGRGRRIKNGHSVPNQPVVGEKRADDECDPAGGPSFALNNSICCTV